MAIYKLSSQELNKEFAEKKEKIDEIQLSINEYKNDINKKLMIVNYALEVANGKQDILGAGITADQSLISFDSKGVATDSNVNIGGYDTSKKVFRHIYINNGQVTLGPTITSSPNNPSGGSPGDIWLKYTE